MRGLKRKDVRIVVIDPGHGGEDPGAVGPRSLKEKDVCLSIAKKLKEKIDKMDKKFSPIDAKLTALIEDAEDKEKEAPAAEKPA